MPLRSIQGITGPQGPQGPQGPAGSSSGYTASTVVDVGPTPSPRKYFVVNDSNVHADSKVFATVTADPATKELDENEMDRIMIDCIAIYEGTFGFWLTPLEGYIHDKYLIFYQVI